jgi:hypothetical protein
MREPLQSRWRARLSWPKRILLLYRSIRLRYCEFEIPETTDSPPLRSVYIGEGISLPYYLKLYQASVSQSREIPVWRARAALSGARAAYPIVLVEINRLLDFLLPSGGLRADSWVQHETDLDSARYRQRRRGIERGWGGKVRKHGYRFALSRNEHDLVVFYQDYYLPHMTHRHGETASTRNIDVLRKALRKGFLLQVWHNEQWVSGIVTDQTEIHRVSILAAGLHASQRQRMQDGALSAAYYFLFQWAVENGLRTIDWCGSRPNQMDGVFQHKTLWAAVPKHDPWHHTEVVFFLATAICLPASIRQQLITRGTNFVSIGEYLSSAGSRTHPRNPSLG